MFPLGSPLLPHTPLALRIFEPRYLTMMGRLLDAEDPVFGVVLIERGHEAGGGDQRASVGTLARALRIEVGADDLFLLAIGEQRVTVDRWRDDDPHPVADLTPIPALEWDDALEPLRREAERVARRVATLASTIGASRWDPDAAISQDPLEACWQIAAIAPLGPYDQYRLLQATTAGGLLRSVIDLCLEEEPVLVARAADAHGDDDADDD